MPDNLRHSQLFAGTAWYYSRFRPPYPDRLFTMVSDKFRLDGTGRLLDVGCGTGLMSIPLSSKFDEVVALDVSGEMLAQALLQITSTGVQNIRLLRMKGEEISPALGRFRLAAFGSSLHWMDIDILLRHCREVLEPGGGVFTAGSPSIWDGASVWEQAVVAVIQRWLGKERRAGVSGRKPAHRPFPDALADAGFVGISSGSIACEYDWDIPHIIGHLYSTSYCNRALLGDKAPAFEQDLGATLLALDASGRFKRKVDVDYKFASRG